LIDIFYSIVNIFVNILFFAYLKAKRRLLNIYTPYPEKRLDPVLFFLNGFII